MVDCLACAFRCVQRASVGTQKMFSAVYSSRSSAASSPNSASTAAWRSSKASEMYFRKIRPSTTCLYSAASIEPRRASAIAHNSASWPVEAPPFGFVSTLSRRVPDLRRAMPRDPSSRESGSRPRSSHNPQPVADYAHAGHMVLATPYPNGTARTAAATRDCIIAFRITTAMDVGGAVAAHGRCPAGAGSSPDEIAEVSAIAAGPASSCERFPLNRPRRTESRPSPDRDHPGIGR